MPTYADPSARSGGRVEAQLEESRRGLNRLSPQQALAAQRDGALLIDTRTPWQRAAQGEVPGALVIDRTVLEWRLDPTSEVCIPEARSGRLTVVLCRQGYSSSLAARSLRELGVEATDVIGGVQAWLDEGLPVHCGPVDERR
ncbi:MAG: sulfurtransferase [Frankiales bacterium]|nr:sulfurtransferase [Frankiales bacterium]